MGTNATAKKFILLPKVQEIVPYSASHIWRLERTGQFPQRVRLGQNRVAWLESEVNAWVDSKIAARTINSHCEDPKHIGSDNWHQTLATEK
jgi:prophage regulatory protein